jgi:hypothetical protein
MWTLLLLLGGLWLIAVGVVMMICTLWHYYRTYPRRVALIIRCESEHTRLINGDNTALYGQYPPAKL